MAAKQQKLDQDAAPSDHCYTGPEDVACDSCLGRKVKATKSCLVCLVSYCEKHLKPHYESPAFEIHKLVDPSKNLQENICSHHGQVMKMFCREDQKCICYLCSVDEHKGHDTVPADKERKVKQRELDENLKQIQQRIQDAEKDVKLLQQEVENINHSADKTVEDSEKIFNHLICLIKKRSSDLKQQIRSQQQTEVREVKELQQKLEQEITELKRKDAELKKLSHTEDHIQFLHHYLSLSALSESTHSSSIKIRPLKYFEDVAAAVSELKEKLQDLLLNAWTNVSLTLSHPDVLLPKEPKSRAEVLEYSCEITLDPNSAHPCLSLSEGNRKVTGLFDSLSHSNNAESFTYWWQVLSRESLTGRCYWEVEIKGDVSVAVAYKNISRTEDESKFGNNNQSWALDCYRNVFSFYHKIRTSISDPRSSRVGVYLDHRAGLLCFYSVSETMTLLHRVQTIFTEPLYAGVGLSGLFSSADFLKVK